jgi:SAM-dependent methyltransferase
MERRRIEGRPEHGIDVSCPCSATLQRDVFEYSILKCWRCHSEFVEPRKAAPPEWYSGGNEFYGWRWEFDRFLEDVRDLKGKTMKVLEVGCGEGVMLEKLRNHCDCWGVDFNAEALRAAKLKGLSVFETLDVVKKASPEIRFDAIVFFHLIEHLEQPLDFLQEVSDVLSPGGHIFCSIPNPDRHALKYQREDWDYPPHHLTRFTKTGVFRLLERAMFKVINLKTAVSMVIMT